MKRSLIGIISILIFISFACLNAEENRNNGVMILRKNTFKESLLDKVDPDREPSEVEKTLSVDPSTLDYPKSLDEFKTTWHFPPVSQDLTGNCWCYSATSLFESEIKRISGREICLSIYYPVYWEYVEKARRFVQKQGESRFSRGSQANAATRLFKKYGIVPESVYNPVADDKVVDDRAMFNEMDAYLESLTESGEWDEKANLEKVRSILDNYLGKPPETFHLDGKEYTPQEYLKNLLRLDMDDYVDFMSLMEEPFYKKAVYDVPDNWWRSNDYYNVPLEEFMQIINNAISNGYTVCIVGDNSEPGFLQEDNIAIIPDFDIPSDYINDAARQIRFQNGATTDDHAIHLVGHTQKNGKKWYLIKDSGNRARNGKHEGYFFYHEDFIKLKMMNIMLHKKPAEDIMKKFETADRGGEVKIEKMAEDLVFPEGPVWHPDGYLLFSDVHGGVICKLLPEGGTEVWFDEGIKTNGLIMSNDGKKIYACCYSERQFLEIDAQTKEYKVLADNYKGREFNNVNDVAIDDEGYVYFTDPKWGAKEGDVQGVYCISPDGNLTLADPVDHQPNGLVVSPDQKWMYVGRSGANDIMRFRKEEGGKLSSGEVWVNLEPGGEPDGMTVDSEGNLYVAQAANGKISVYSPEGERLHLIKIAPRMVTNCEFHGDNESILYVTRGGTRNTREGEVFKLTFPE